MADITLDALHAHVTGELKRLQSLEQDTPVKIGITQEIIQSDEFLFNATLFRDIEKNVRHFTPSLLTQIYGDYRAYLDGINSILKTNSNAEDLDWDIVYFNVFETFGDKRDKWLKDILPIITYTRVNNLDLVELSTTLNESREEIRKINKLYIDLQTKVTEFDKRYAEPISKLEKLFQQDKFEDNAKRYKVVAHIWLTVGAIVGLALCYFAGNFLIHDSTEWNFVASLPKFDKNCEGCFQSVLYIEMIKSIVYRILIISILTLVLTLCIRNYNAQMHNSTINLHKSNSLYASGVLLNSIESSQGKEKIALQAANSIFQQQPTGYNQKEIAVLANVLEQAGKVVPVSSKASKQ